MRIFGFDPGIDNSSYVIINETGKVLKLGFLINDYKKVGPKVDQVLKIQCMADIIRKELRKLKKVDLAYFETTIAFSNFKGKRFFNESTLSRMAIASGTACGAINAEKIVFVPPSRWKTKQNKEENKEALFNSLNYKLVERLLGMINKAEIKEKQQHNIIDAFGIAIYAMRGLL